jgi:hypothetical protein
MFSQQQAAVTDNSVHPFTDTKRGWWVATVCLSVILCASAVPNLVTFFLGDGAQNLAAYPLPTSVIAAVLQVLAAFWFACQFVQSTARRIALTLSVILGWFVALPISVVAKFMTDHLQESMSTLESSESRLLKVWQTLEPASAMSLVGIIAVLCYLLNSSWLRALVLMAFLPLLIIVKYFIMVFAFSYASKGWAAFLVSATALFLPMVMGFMLIRRLANAIRRRYLIACLIGVPVWFALSVLIIAIDVFDQRHAKILDDDSYLIFPLFMLPILITWIGLRVSTTVPENANLPPPRHAG